MTEWGRKPLPTSDQICGSIPGLSDLSSLSSGGQKLVLRGRHGGYGDVVIKLFNSEPGDGRVKREIELASSYEIGNTPKFYSSGVVVHDDFETTYMLEQYVSGETLRAILERESRLSTQDSVSLLRSLLNVVAVLEQFKLVHRDIKPENVIFHDDGSWWLIDLGIARHLELESLTATHGLGVATPGYAPPEQFLNSKREIDVRTDLFSIGVVMYECLSGEHPFRHGATSVTEILERTQTVVPLMLSIDGDSQGMLAGYVATLMSKQPSRRPKDAKQAIVWLDAILPRLEGMMTEEKD